MDAKNIRQYAELMREMDLTALELHLEDGSIRMERNLSAVAPAVAAQTPAALPAQPTPVASACPPGTVEVTSPMVGVFYAAPAEDARPFVQVGDAVHAGDVLCIIEAMKLMNEIVAEQDGVISEIMVTNGAVVEFGQVIFRMRKEPV